MPKLKLKKIDLRVTTDQFWFDPVQNKTVKVKYLGRCPITGQTLYDIEGRDGDPRGPINEKHIATIFVAKEYGFDGPDIAVAWRVRNERKLYDRFFEYAKKFWQVAA